MKGSAASKKSRASKDFLYELEVSLVGTEPRVWRRILIPSRRSFLELHRAIQDAFEWKSCHLWEFRSQMRGGDCIAGMGGKDEFTGKPIPDAKQKLASGFEDRIGASCFYLYDFGDDWIHEVVLKATRPFAPGFARQLLEGEFAGPPEDLGGPYRYQECVELIRTGKISQRAHAELREWLAGWHPDDFDLEKKQREFDLR